MKKFWLIALTFSCHHVMAQTVLKGRVVDQLTGAPLQGATVAVNGHAKVVTDNDGQFSIDAPGKSNHIHVSHVGYLSQQVSINGSQMAEISLIPGAELHQDVIVSASRHPEKITKAPAAVRLIGQQELKRYAGSNVGELFAHVQGIEYTRSGVEQVMVNARGFNSAFNNKMMMIIDGRISIAALSGALPLFNNASINKEDLDKVEIVLGPQSALYGPNAHNGLFNYVSKDPRSHSGTTVAISGGNQSQFSARMRQAGVAGEKWAYKITAEYARGTEFEFYDSVYLAPTATARAVAEHNVNFNFLHQRAEGALYYSLRPGTDLILNAGASQHDFLQVTTSGRNQMRGLANSILQLRLANPRFFLNVYQTYGNIGTSYNLTSYTRDFTNARSNGLTADQAEGQAMRPGNRYKEDGRRWNADVQYNNRWERAGVHLVSGASFQKDLPRGYGINLMDRHQKIVITQHGYVAQLEKTLPAQMKLLATTRWDFHNVYGNFISPRFALVKEINGGSVRLTHGKAYAMPSILHQFAAINSFVFGNGKGITYIPVGTAMNEAAKHLRTTDPLKPEEVITWEAGIKAQRGKWQYAVDLYSGQNKNFLSPLQTVQGRALEAGGIKLFPLFPGITNSEGKLAGAQFLTFFNYGQVKNKGIDAALDYHATAHVSAGVKYSFYDADITTPRIGNDANKDQEVTPDETSLNAPRHRGWAHVQFRNLVRKKLDIRLATRTMSTYDFFSGEQVSAREGAGARGTIHRQNLPPLYKNFNRGPLGGFTSFDLNLHYRIHEKLTLNSSITNLLNTRQRESAGAPLIGRLMMLELRMHLPD